MQQITIDINNFDSINNFRYITKAKDRDGNEGILLFIPSINMIKELGD